MIAKILQTKQIKTVEELFVFIVYLQEKGEAIPVIENVVEQYGGKTLLREALAQLNTPLSMGEALLKTVVSQTIGNRQVSPVAEVFKSELYNLQTILHEFAYDPYKTSAILSLYIHWKKYFHNSGWVKWEPLYIFKSSTIIKLIDKRHIILPIDMRVVGKNIPLLCYKPHFVIMPSETNEQGIVVQSTELYNYLSSTLKLPENTQ